MNQVGVNFVVPALLWERWRNREGRWIHRRGRGREGRISLQKWLLFHGGVL